MIYWLTVGLLGLIALSAIWGLWGLVRRDLKERYPSEWSRFVIWKTNRRLDRAERRIERSRRYRKRK